MTSNANSIATFTPINAASVISLGTGVNKIKGPTKDKEAGFFVTKLVRVVIPEQKIAIRTA